MYDIFISHSSKDKSAYVRKLYRQLTELGSRAWLDEEVILSGDNILEAIKKGVSESLCTVLILTPHFFDSNWASLEIGLSMSGSSTHIIPVIANISETDISSKFPFLLMQKYLLLSDSNVRECAIEIFSVIMTLRERRIRENPLDYQDKVRQLNNFDSPGTNKISILISEYEQICKISVPAGVTHASSIASAIIEDVYSRVKRPDDPYKPSHHETLNILLERNSGLNRNVKEHLDVLAHSLQSQTSSLSNDIDKKRITDLSLASILDWYLSYVSVVLRRNKSDERIDIAWPEELSFDDFVDMHEIDRLVLRPDLIAPPEVTYGWYQYNNFSHVAVRSSVSQKIVGYFTLFPVTDELFEKIKSGNFKDNDLDVSCIRRYDIPDFYKLYVACVCVHPDYQNTTAFTRLYNALIKMMYDLATEREACITEIITEASTPQGLKLCKILGFKKLMDTNLATELYGATLLPPSLRLNSSFGSKLIRFYQDKYFELRDLF